MSLVASFIVTILAVWACAVVLWMLLAIAFSPSTADRVLDVITDILLFAWLLDLLDD